ncbi:MAG TPA: response regulator [Phycisphaerae bacterium]|jgi:HD-like signal output (HDOD) protein/CheY-like chemotaxis protein|nr:HDOD domain-containing protein [Phycisphaerae bacterium]HOJ53129.1 response regulator [Phycisphaerae bacterium]HQA44313.1 response regulator [Phycisphaerae bacterium]HXK86358.1 response regulator [Phycisphaerae bacterium]
MMNHKTRILFVDDEPHVLEGLRRILRRYRDRWEMEFVSSGPEALALMEASPFNVIVTDMMLPGMDGAELLERVVERYPGTARIALSGHADEQASARALRVAHRYLAKPTDAQALEQAVAEACNAQKIVSDERVRALVGLCGSLPSAPDLYMQIMRAAESQTADAQQIGEIISQDMAMAAKLLQMVNSAFFGIARRVSSIERAVALLGIMRIKALVLQEHIFREYVPPADLTDVPIDSLWRHALAVAEMARMLSRAEGQTGDRPDQAFTAGLMHDIGWLVLAARQFDQLNRVLKIARQERRAVHEVEKEILGLTHADIGSYLLHLWGLPSRIVEAVELHHRPSDTSYDGVCALTVVHVADVLVCQTVPSLHGPDVDVWTQEVDTLYLDRIQLAHRLDAWRSDATAALCRVGEMAS